MNDEQRSEFNYGIIEMNEVIVEHLENLGITKCRATCMSRLRHLKEFIVINGSYTYETYGQIVAIKRYWFKSKA